MERRIKDRVKWVLQATLVYFMFYGFVVLVSYGVIVLGVYLHGILTLTS